MNFICKKNKYLLVVTNTPVVPLLPVQPCEFQSSPVLRLFCSPGREHTVHWLGRQTAAPGKCEGGKEKKIPCCSILKLSFWGMISGTFYFKFSNTMCLFTFTPAAAAGLPGSTAWIWHGARPRTTKPQPTASPITYHCTKVTYICIIVLLLKPFEPYWDKALWLTLEVNVAHFILAFYLRKQNRNLVYNNKKIWGKILCCSYISSPQFQWDFILPLLSVCAPNFAIICYNVVIIRYKLNIFTSIKVTGKMKIITNLPSTLFWWKGHPVPVALHR